MRDGDKIVLASDRCSSQGDRKHYKEQQKFFSKPIMVDYGDDSDKEDTICVVIAFTGYINVANYIKFGFVAPKIGKDEDFPVYLSGAFLPELKKSLKETGLIQIDKEETNTGSSFYLFYNNIVYDIDHNLGFTFTTERKFDSCGSGSHFALGSLSTTSSRMNPEKRLKKAIESAAMHLGSVDDNIDITTLEMSDYVCKPK